MDESHLYNKISAELRQQILDGSLAPGERLPSVRAMAEHWRCTVGTVQHAYRQLVRQGLVTSRAGQGTRVVAQPNLMGETPLRRAALVHKAEAFLLEAISTGYSLPEVERALRQAMDRWRAVEIQDQGAPAGVLRFAGSHDLAMAWLAGQFAEIVRGYSLEILFNGSLQGLIALASGKVDLAGSHLWDEESGQYNTPFVRRLLPGRHTALITLARRRIGLILPEGNPHQVSGLSDLASGELRLANRQTGSGTRVWLDAMLGRMGTSGEAIVGYSNTYLTHTAVAQAVAEGQADVGIGQQGAALSYGLDFIPLVLEPYELVAPEEIYALSPVQRLCEWLSSAPARQAIETLGGYDSTETGHIRWVE